MRCRMLSSAYRPWRMSDALFSLCRIRSSVYRPWCIMTVDLSFRLFTEQNLVCVQGKFSSISADQVFLQVYLQKYLHICICLGICKYTQEHLEPGARVCVCV